MKEKLKKIFKTIINFTLTDEFKIGVMTLLFGLLIITFIWASAMTAISNDLVSRVQDLEKSKSTLEIENENLINDNVRYKMMYEETYELFISCVETKSWCEEFYYDNVDPYTGEVEGEYYE